MLITKTLTEMVLKLSMGITGGRIRREDIQGLGDISTFFDLGLDTSAKEVADRAIVALEKDGSKITWVSGFEQVPEVEGLYQLNYEAGGGNDLDRIIRLKPLSDGVWQLTVTGSHTPSSIITGGERMAQVFLSLVVEFMKLSRNP